MCGRYVNPATAEAERYCAIHLVRWQFERSYNVAPTQPVPVVRQAEGEREGLMMRWGLVPFFGRGIPPKYSTINATIERCILPATGFYEWHLNEDVGKTPFYITMADRPVFGFAGLWDRSVAADGNAIESCTIITMPPNALMAEIHNVKQRMPAILAVEAIEAWLGRPTTHVRSFSRTHRIPWSLGRSAAE